MCHHTKTTDFIQGRVVQLNVTARKTGEFPKKKKKGKKGRVRKEYGQSPKLRKHSMDCDSTEEEPHKAGL